MRRLAWGLVVLVLATAALVGGAAAWGWKRLNEPFRGYPGGELEITIESGAGGRRILEQLESERVIRDARLARLYLLYGLEDPPLKAGEYLFERPLSTPEVLAKLARGEVTHHSVTVVEGLSLEETAQALGEAGFGKIDRFLETMRDPARIVDLDADAETLEGYLFPDTYFFARGTTEVEIVDTLVETFTIRLRRVHSTSSRQTVRELVTLASIIEKEAQLDDERPLVASVFVNRLRRRIPLAADPTVIFALKLEGRWDGNIRKPDLKLKSPYNTYVTAGLPPGPICSPGLASLQAAASPADTDNLYFVSRNDGSHVFAKTLAEHNRNVDLWQRQYWRKRWARERAER